MALTGLRAAFGGALAMLAAGCVTDGASTTAPKTPTQASEEPSTAEKIWDSATTRAGKAKDAITGYFTEGDACGDAAQSAANTGGSMLSGVFYGLGGGSYVGNAAASAGGNLAQKGATAATSGASDEAKAGCATKPAPQ